jgi:hypothetical protein
MNIRIYLNHKKLAFRRVFSYVHSLVLFRSQHPLGNFDFFSLGSGSARRIEHLESVLVLENSDMLRPLDGLLHFRL